MASGTLKWFNMLWIVEQFEESNKIEKEHILWHSSFISGNIPLEKFLYRSLYKMLYNIFLQHFKNNFELEATLQFITQGITKLNMAYSYNEIKWQSNLNTRGTYTVSK